MAENKPLLKKERFEIFTVDGEPDDVWDNAREKCLTVGEVVDTLNSMAEKNRILSEMYNEMSALKKEINELKMWSEFAKAARIFFGTLKEVK